jgi:phosphoserine phosphatase RsbU/P
MPERSDSLPCGIVEFTDDGVITYANAAVAEWLGETAEALVGRKFEQLLTVANRIFFQTHFFPLLTLHGHAEEIFLSLRGSGNRTVPVVASARRHETAEGARSQCVFLTVHERRKYEDEILEARKRAEEALANNDELRASQRQLELKTQQLERRVREIQTRNEDLQHATQILSHDLREPIRKIGLFADLVRGHLPPQLEPEAAEALRKIDAEARKMQELIHAVRDFLQPAMDGAFAAVDLNAVVQRTAASVAMKLGFTDWVLECGKLPSVEGSAALLQAMFAQLLENSVKFRDPARRLRITVRGRIIQQNILAASGEYRYADFAQIEFEDNGRGFDPKYRDYVFGLLKKVDLASPGLGVGLALCRKIVALHYGSIRVDPRPAVGTVFTIELPLVLTLPPN